MRIRLQFPGPSREIHVRLTEGAWMCGVCLIIAAVVALITDLGKRADLSYYATIAQVIPVFLLAVVVDARARMREHMEYALAPIRQNEEHLREIQEIERSIPERFRDEASVQTVSETIRDLETQQASLRSEVTELVGWVRRLLRDYAVVGVPGEVACLAVLAARGGGTFAFCIAGLSLLAMVVLWVRSLGTPFKLEW